MFNERTVLDYIKGNLGSPKTHLELLDTEILDIITGRARKKFSTYHPREKLIVLTPSNLVLNTDNIYTIPDDPLTLEPPEIITVEAIYTTTTTTLSEIDYATGDSGDMFSGVNNALLAPKRDKLTFKFDSPNLLSCFGTTNTDNIYVKAKIAHDLDCTTIPINKQEIFLENALILVAKNILPIRDKYARIGSPIGDIQLNVEFIREIAQREETFFREKLHTVGALSTRCPVIIA